MKFKQSPLAIALTSALIANSTYAATENAVTQTEQTLQAEQTEPAIEVITVQSDFKKQSLQEMASTLSVLTSEDMAQRNSQNLEELVGAVPNVNFASGSQRARYYQIRGIGERSQFQEPINPSVGILIDDIDFSGIGSVASTFDMAQTEIYRGPQGTRFGANALAGLIYMTSNAPTDEFEGSIRLKAGNYDALGAALMLSGPATDSVNYRFSAEQYQDNGYMENVYLGVDDTNNRDELSLRGKLAIEATQDLDIDISVLHFNFENGYDAFSLDNTRDTYSDEPGFDNQETTAASVKFNYQGLSAFDLVSILTYANSDLAYGYDEDWSNTELCQINDCPYGDYSSTDYYFRDKQTATAEFRFLSKEDQKIFAGSTDWVTGIYFKQEQEDLLRQYTWNATDFTSTFDANSIAAFIEFNSQLSERFSLITGLRYERRDSEYDNNEPDSTVIDPSDDMVGGKVVLAYQANQDNLLFASINRGYKAGGVNTDGTIAEEDRAFDPEYLWNYELGYKLDFANNLGYLRTALFYMDREDMQIKNSNLIEDNGYKEWIEYIDNASTGYNYGIEIDSAIFITDNLELYGALGLLQTEFTHYVYDEDTDEELEINREQAHAPSYQYNLGVNYFIGESWLINVAVDGKDKFYFSDSHLEQSEPATLLHASVGYSADAWQVKLWARNILDELYATRGFGFGNDPRNGYSDPAHYQYGEPAVFGLTFDYHF